MTTSMFGTEPVAVWCRLGHFVSDAEALGAFKLAYQQGLDGMGPSIREWMGLTHDEYSKWMRDPYSLPVKRGKRTESPTPNGERTMTTKPEETQAPLTVEQKPLEPGFTTAELTHDAHARAIRKGWWELKIREGGDGSALLAPFNLPEKIALIHSEASEALESYRRNEPLVWFRVKEDGTQKPEGLAIELADVVIRVADLCGAMNIDLDKAVLLKSAYNETRPWRHGDRLA